MSLRGCDCGACCDLHGHESNCMRNEPLPEGRPLKAREFLAALAAGYELPRAPWGGESS